MRRILVGGSSGAGKTTLARALGLRLAIPFVEVDSLFHGPNWVTRPEFVADIDAFTAQPAWVIDQDYEAAREIVWPRLDTFIWLDYSRAVCEWRVIRRSLPRALRRQELWNGNRERFWAMVFDPEHPVRWSWTHHADKRARYAAVAAAPGRADLSVVRLSNPQAARRWLEALPRG